MNKTIITGFHAIEEQLKKAIAEKSNTQNFILYYSKIGPRVKKILATAKSAGFNSEKVMHEQLDGLVLSLDATARDHRGIVLALSGFEKKNNQFVDFDTEIEKICAHKKNKTIVLLDAVTDPHNVGAIIRSCDQFKVDLLVMAESNSPKNSEIISRASAGANAWVAVSVVPNLVRAVQKLKEKKFWIYAADMGGEPAPNIQFPSNTALVMGSEGSGIRRLLKQSCDTTVFIPTDGRLDSLNVSVAAGILMYEVYRQKFVQTQL
ncbi:MAG TPA: 23S rRNA (guanosine(2251)-2'-O)-methyltransferase RlmB [Treponemataceae bacterium]|nr:23S rRNA (guanosine(2251)-2'-O)-methyltransferase RlmB [Treponemataceae bacterium]